jgi:hypothetical protein
MRYIDYYFDITERGIEFCDRDENMLKSEHIQPGVLLCVEHTEDGRLFLRVIAQDTLDYHLYT